MSIVPQGFAADPNDPNDRTLSDRLFKPHETETPLDLPGVAGRSMARVRYQQDPLDRMNRPGSPPGAPPGVPMTPTDETRANALVAKLAQYFRNTNITASLPAHSTPMPWSNNIDLSATISLPGAVGPYQTVIEYTAEPSRYGRISGYGADVAGGFTYDGSILWRILINGGPAPSLTGWAEHRGSLTEPASTFLIVPMQQTVMFQVRRAVAAGSPSTVAMVLKGWDWLLRKNDEGTKASITAF